MHGFLKGDWHFFYPESISSLLHLPSSWDSFLNTGIGMPESTSWITFYLTDTSFFAKFLPWYIFTFIFWILPIFLIGFFSAYFLGLYIFSGKKTLSVVSAIIFISNTYFLLILGGGQMGIAFAYAFTPLVFLQWMHFFHGPSYKKSLYVGLVIALQMLFDPRIVFLTFFLILLYSIWNVSKALHKLKKLLGFLFIIFLIVFLLHGFWLLPLLFFRQIPLPNGFSDVSDVKFFSFADFPHVFSLLHPNWPENIFGKVYFMRPEYILLPIIAFSSLFFLRKSKIGQKSVLFFVLLGLIGAFLAKGTNDPFGSIYFWLYNHIPFFTIFRDATKFYLFVALSYAILIPFALEQIAKKIANTKFNLHTAYYILLTAFLLFWIFLIRQIFVGLIFRPYVIPREYVSLKNFLIQDTSFSRTLWVPSLQRYGYFSDVHPAIGRGELFGSSQSAIIQKLQQPQTEKILQDISVRYVIIPYDSEGEIFTNDRRYDDTQYQKMITSIRKVSYLHEVRDFGKIAIFEVNNFRGHFWLTFSNNLVSFKKINPTEYNVQVHNDAEMNTLIFSEGFNKNWRAKIGNNLISSTPYDRLINSFALPGRGDFKITVHYKPQQTENAGLAISIITAVIVIVFLLTK